MGCESWSDGAAATPYEGMLALLFAALSMPTSQECLYSYDLAVQRRYSFRSYVDDVMTRNVLYDKRSTVRTSS